VVHKRIQGKSTTIKKQQSRTDPESRVVSQLNGFREPEQFKEKINTKRNYDQAPQSIAHGME
jgi:starvation-inducible outer membrane lipoprotein